MNFLFLQPEAASPPRISAHNVCIVENQTAAPENNHGEETEPKH
jgi:hypothetical protein